MSVWHFISSTKYFSTYRKIKTNFLFVFISSYDQAVEIIGVFIFTSRKYWIPNDGGFDTYTKNKRILSVYLSIRSISFSLVVTCCFSLPFVEGPYFVFDQRNCGLTCWIRKSINSYRISTNININVSYQYNTHEYIYSNKQKY